MPKVTRRVVKGMKAINLSLPFVVMDKLNQLKLYYRAPSLSHAVRLAIEDAYSSVIGKAKVREKVKDEKGTEAGSSITN